MKTKFTTTIEEEILSQLKIYAIQNKVSVNTIIEEIAKRLINGEIKIKFNSK